MPTPSPGLSHAEAAARLASEGPNELPREAARTPLRIVTEVLKEPMLALLLAGGVVYLLLGDVGEAFFLLLFASLSIVITVVQELRTERVLESLRELTSPRALVIREGERVRVAGRDLVRGDLVVLSEGDRVPADLHLLEAQHLQVDESLLTGESIPVRKRASTLDPPAHTRPGGDDLPIAYAATLVVHGNGIGEVIATGIASEVGKIGKTLATLATEAPQLQQQIVRLVRFFAIVGLGISLLVVVLFSALRGELLAAVLAGITTAMSLLPEEFPVVLAVTLAMGAWRISQARVLTRRATAIEALGAATVLCTDKTGTLTENRMQVVALQPWRGERVPVESPVSTTPASLQPLVQAGVLASAVEPFDPMEKAFHRLAEGQQFTGYHLIKQWPLRIDLLAMAQAWEVAVDAPLLVVAKGAPEAIARLCRLGEAETQQLQEQVNAMAASGLRVLGLAQVRRATSSLPEALQDLPFECLGLAGLSDPLRKSVPAAVAECRSAGIRVVMITGDYPTTAQAIARQAGIDASSVMSGQELASLDDASLRQRLAGTRVFARIMPEQKLRLVSALKAAGEVVAMTGDGVNDAPSLKAAHIGVAMGGRGTDVAREAASLVLLDDDFGSIVTTVRLGRRIYDNLRKAIGFLFAVHVPLAILALLPLVTGLPLLFGPVHIAFLEMVIDPVCSLVFEAESEEPDLMQRPPRNPLQPLMSSRMLLWGVLQGLLAGAVVAGFYLSGLHWGMPVAEVRSLCFVVLVVAIVVLTFVNRSSGASLITALLRPNKALAIVLPAIALMLSLTLLLPLARDLFAFGPLHPDDLLTVLLAALALLLTLQGLKLIIKAPLK